MNEPCAARRSIIALEPTHDAHHWRLPLSADICTGPRDGPTFMFGGIGLAAAIDALERTLGQPTLWATAQYISYARPPATVDIKVRVLAAGKQTSQACAIERVDGRDVVAVQAALGDRAADHDGQWVAMPSAPPPGACPVVRHWAARGNALQGQLEIRLASGRYPDGQAIQSPGSDRFLVWIRSTVGYVADSRMLAVIGDFVSIAISDRLGRYADGNSLDNTIRFAAAEDCEWVLCEIVVQSLHRGVVHGTMNIFSQNGRLLAVASQSLIARLYRPTPDGRPPGPATRAPIDESPGGDAA